MTTLVGLTLMTSCAVTFFPSALVLSSVFFDCHM